MATSDVVSKPPGFFNKTLSQLVSLRRRGSKSHSTTASMSSSVSPGTPMPPRTHTPKCSTREDELKRVFGYFDLNKDGKISATELSVYFEFVRPIGDEHMSVLPKEQVEKLIDDLDSDGDSLLDFQDFLRLTKMDAGSDAQDLEEAFNMFADKWTGCIQPNNLQKMLQLVGETKSYGECQKIIQVYDIDGNGMLDFNEFQQMIATEAPPDPGKASIVPDPGDDGIIRNLLGKLKSKGIAGPSPPQPDPMVPAEGLMEELTRKLLRVAQLEAVKARLRKIQESCILYSDFVRVCGEGHWYLDQGPGLAKTLDESGDVIVMGNVVFLRPEQMAKANKSLMEELAEMEKQRAEIYKKVDAKVRRELWAVLVVLVMHILLSILLISFKVLSWSVMEPICFYLTSMYCMTGYAYFLWISKEPSFEGFYQTRFDAKQKQAMKKDNFNIARYKELWTACYEPSGRKVGWSRGVKPSAFKNLSHSYRTFSGCPDCAPSIADRGQTTSTD